MTRKLSVNSTEKFGVIVVGAKCQKKYCTECDTDTCPMCATRKIHKNTACKKNGTNAVTDPGFAKREGADRGEHGPKNL